MDLTFQAPVARHAESARPPMRSPSTSARCYNCGQTGHLRSACRLPRHAPSPQPSSVGFGQHVSRSPRTSADVFRFDGALRRCFNYGSTAISYRCVILVHRLPGCLDGFPPDDFRRCRSKVDSKVRCSPCAYTPVVHRWCSGHRVGLSPQLNGGNGWALP